VRGLDVNDETIWQDHKSDLIRYATVLVGGAEAVRFNNLRRGVGESE
jgi:hypothetical protein